MAPSPRLGGDEFVAVVQDLAAADLDALTVELHRPLSYNGVSLPLAASVGVCRLAELPVPLLTDALAAADAAMYEAKGRGRRGSRLSLTGRRVAHKPPSTPPPGAVPSNRNRKEPPS